jgi:hypothetical protein
LNVDLLKTKMTVIENKDCVAVIDRKIQDQPKCFEVKKKGVSNLMETISLLKFRRLQVGANWN